MEILEGVQIDHGINRLFMYCKGSNFNVHIWA